MATKTKLMTAVELLVMPSSDDGTRYELVRGELIEMAPAGDQHGAIAFTIANILGTHTRGKDLGRGYTADTGFFLTHDPDTVRAPDVAFISKDRLPSDRPRKGFTEVAPDLAVEVISPSESATSINAKVEEYFVAGTRLVWVVYPDTKSVAVYRSIKEAVVLHVDDVLDGTPIFEDFHVKVSEFFE
jgi:Uma2 family endonuclease